MIPEGKDWIDVVTALAVPIIAALAAYISFLNFRLQRQKRQDDLWDRRFEFFREIEARWMRTGSGTTDDQQFDVFEKDGWASQAELLFGDDVAEHIHNLDEGGYCGGPAMFHDQEFRRPFLKYLKLNP